MGADRDAGDDRTNKGLRLYFRMFLAIWLLGSAVRITLFISLITLEAQSRLDFTPLIFVLWPEIAIFRFDQTTLYLVDYMLLVSTALCCGTAVIAAIVTAAFAFCWKPCIRACRISR